MDVPECRATPHSSTRSLALVALWLVAVQVLMDVPECRASFEATAEAIEGCGIDLMEILNSDSPQVIKCHRTVHHSTLTPTITPIAHQCQPPPATPPHHSASLCSHNRNFASTQVLRSATNALCAITAVQIALVDALYSLNIPVAGIVGHSLGEVAAAYVRTCLCARYLGYTGFRNNLAMVSMRTPPQLRPTTISSCAHANVFDRHLMYSS
jgi:acyl transferase domain-containing protein